MENSLVLIKDINEYKHMVRGNHYINNVFSAAEALRYLNEGRLMTFPGSDKILVFDEKTFYELIVSEDIEADSIAQLLNVSGKSCAIHVFEDNNKEYSGIKEKLLSAGMTFNKRILEYAAQTDAVPENEIKLPDGYVFQDVLTDEDLEFIIDMWRSDIPVFEMPWITVSMMKQIYDKGRMIVVQDLNKNRIAGASYYDILLGRSTEHHVTVQHEYRNKGLAGAIINKWIRMPGVKKVISWIDEDNISSRKCHIRSGLAETGARAWQYIYLCQC